MEINNEIAVSVPRCLRGDITLASNKNEAQPPDRNRALSAVTPSRGRFHDPAVAAPRITYRQVLPPA